MNSLPRPIALISLLLQGALLLFLLNILVIASFTTLEMGLIRFDLNGHPTPDWLWDLSDNSLTWTHWSSLTIFLVTGYLFLRWIYLACHNSFAIRRELRTGHYSTSLAVSRYITPGWSIGFYFIPIANFWKPYSAMKQINEATSNLTGISVARLLPFWWFFWLTDGIADSILENAWNNAETNEEYFLLDMWYSVTYFCSATLTVLALIIVRRITRAQYEALGTPELEADSPDAESSLAT